jgi:hypothetical protein
VAISQDQALGKCHSRQCLLLGGSHHATIATNLFSDGG